MRRRGETKNASNDLDISAVSSASSHDPLLHDASQSDLAPQSEAQVSAQQRALRNQIQCKQHFLQQDAQRREIKLTDRLKQMQMGHSLFNASRCATKQKEKGVAYAMGGGKEKEYGSTDKRGKECVHGGSVKSSPAPSVQYGSVKSSPAPSRKSMAESSTVSPDPSRSLVMAKKSKRMSLAVPPTSSVPVSRNNTGKRSMSVKSAAQSVKSHQPSVASNKVDIHVDYPSASNHTDHVVSRNDSFDTLGDLVDGHERVDFREVNAFCRMIQEETCPARPPDDVDQPVCHCDRESALRRLKKNLTNKCFPISISIYHKSFFRCKVFFL